MPHLCIRTARCPRYPRVAVLADMNEVTLTFHLGEEVTPDLFAEKIAYACARGGAIRPGEKVQCGWIMFTYESDNEIVELGGTVIGNLPTITRREYA
jgi:hypothetical protein